MSRWSPIRPRRSGRCKYTKRFSELLRAHFSHLLDRRGIVRQFDERSGEAFVRWDDTPGEIFRIHITHLVREDHEGDDPLDERDALVSEPRVAIELSEG